MTDELDPEGAAAILELGDEIEQRMVDRLFRDRAEVERRIGNPDFTLDERRAYEFTAVRTAIHQALAAGYNRGCERTAFEFLEKTGRSVDLHPDVMQVKDLWASRYGLPGSS